MQRPQAMQCREHPFFWNNAKILQFLMECSDYIEKCHKSHELRVCLEMNSKQIIGDDWGLFVDAELLNDAGKHRKYNFESMRDYLRLIRNKWNHFGELPQNIKTKLSQQNNSSKSANQFVYYFTQFTPNLLMFCYKLIGSALNEEYDAKIKAFHQYYHQITPQRIQSFHHQVRGRYNFRRWLPKH